MTSEWFIHAPKPGARTRLYLFPYAGGNPGVFQPWGSKLAPDIELAVVNLRHPHQASKDLAQVDMVQTAKEIAIALANENITDFAFMGHSMGAVLAFEVARIATLMHLKTPRLLIVSGAHWPGHFLDANPTTPLLDMSDAQMMERLKTFGGTPPEILKNSELMELVLPFFRADFAMLHRYSYRPGIPINATMHAFSGRDDSLVEPAYLEGWMQETAHPGLIHWFDGAHFFIHEHQDEIIAKLNALLT